MILTEGTRVRLRMMRREDADELYALLSDEAVMRWLEPPFNRAQAERFLEQAGLKGVAFALRDSFEVAADFHPRHCDTKKTYCYRILNTQFGIPQKRNYT